MPQRHGTPPPLLRFTKMHGLGNDFMVVDAISQPCYLRPEQIQQLADRHLGVGFDQLLLVEPPTRPDVDFRYRIFNADGGEVEQCGNGARCFARFVRDQRLTHKTHIRVATQTGVIELRLTSGRNVQVDMGMPCLEPAAIPFDAPARATQYPVVVDLPNGDSQTVMLAAVSMGNPHAVIQVDDLAQAPVQTLGALLECHARFPRKVNVGFMQRMNETHIRLRVFERGVGETLACGTGACAAVVAGRLQGLLAKRVKVSLPGGDLWIEWTGEGAPVMMEGPAVRVYDGQIRLRDLVRV